jgi:hypothetical protein
MNQFGEVIPSVNMLFYICIRQRHVDKRVRLASVVVRRSSIDDTFDMASQKVCFMYAYQHGLVFFVVYLHTKIQTFFNTHNLCIHCTNT